VKKIEATIEPYEVEGMKEDLSRIGVGRMMVTEVHSFGLSRGLAQVYRGMRCESPFAIEAKIEVVVPDEMAEGVIAAIRDKAKSDESGESDIRVFSLEDTSRLRAVRRQAAVV
jgi:nitrogen regulatory protein P-II 1